MISQTADKNSKESVRFEIPLAKAGDRMRMEMDLSRMAKGSQGMPSAMSKMTSLHLGDKKISYTLYPNAKKYIVASASAKDTSTGEEAAYRKNKGRQ